MRRNNLFAARAVAAGLDINKDFFELSGLELSLLDNVRKSFKFSGKNYLGRSKCRQFWYAIQKAK